MAARLDRPNHKTKDDKSTNGFRRTKEVTVLSGSIAESVESSPVVRSGSNLIVAERQHHVICLKRDGYSIMEIAEVMRMKPHEVIADIKSVLELTLGETAEATEVERALQVARIDQLIQAYTPFAINSHKESMVDKRTGQVVVVEQPPDPAYGNLILAAEARRAKLLALDKPETKRLDVTAIRQYVGVDVEDV